MSTSTRAEHAPRVSAGSSTDPTPTQLWRAARTPVAVAALVLLVALVLALFAAGGSSGALDPRAAGRAGSKALAQVLRSQDVDVALVTTTDAVAATATAGDTVLVAFPGRLVEEQLRRLDATSADLVLVAPGSEALAVLAPGVEPAGQGDGDPRGPQCSDEVARRAGVAEVGELLYGTGSSSRSAVTPCYPGGGGAGLVRVRDGGRTVTVIGAAAPFSNDRLDDEGNAALALGLVGAHPRLLWYLPSLADVPAAGRRSLVELVPRGVLLGAVQLLVAVVLLALWRMRRLGPVVPEPLPVVVPATETVRGRARLYRRARARDRAADTLREASRARLTASLGLARAAAPATLVSAVSDRTGRAPDDVGWLMYGAAPADDAALVSLAAALPALEGEVRRQ